MDTLYWIVAVGSVVCWIWLRHPIFSVSLITAFSLLVGEFYPFSNFPMYGDPDESENYFYIAEAMPDGTNEALPVRRLTGITAPKVKKMYKSRLKAHLEERAEAEGVRKVEPTAQDRRKIGLDMLAYLRDQADGRQNQLPGKTSLVEVWIVYDGETGYSETPETVAVHELTP